MGDMISIGRAGLLALVLGGAGVAGAQQPQAQQQAPQAQPQAQQQQQAAEQTGNDTEVVDLGSVGKVKELCLATRPAGRVLFAGDEVAKAEAKEAFQASREAALHRLYRARIPAAGLKLGDYRAKDGTLSLDLGRPLRALHGALNVAVPSDTEVQFAVTPQQAKDVGAAAKAGTLALDAFFELDDDQGAVCSGSAAAEVFNVSAEPVAFELRDAMGTLVSRAEMPLADKWRLVFGGYSGVPTAQLGAVEGDGSDALGLARRLSGVSDPLKRCYAKRLEEKADAGGTVVIGVNVLADGRVDSVSFIADALRDEPLRRCIEESVKAVRFGGITGLPTLFRVPVELKLAKK